MGIINKMYSREVTKALTTKAKVVLPSENTTTSIYRIKNGQFKSIKTNVFSTRHSLECIFVRHAQTKHLS